MVWEATGGRLGHAQLSQDSPLFLTLLFEKGLSSMSCFHFPSRPPWHTQARRLLRGTRVSAPGMLPVFPTSLPTSFPSPSPSPLQLFPGVLFSPLLLNRHPHIFPGGEHIAPLFPKALSVLPMVMVAAWF